MENQTLQSQNLVYRKMVENANESILIIQNGIIKFFNYKLVEYTGYTIEELQDKLFLDFIHVDDRAMLMENHIKRLKGEEFTHIYPFRIVNKNKKIIWAQVNAILFEWEGKPATLNFVTDITMQKEMTEKLKEYYKNLEKMVEERTHKLFETSEKLKKLLDNIVQAFVLIVEKRDPYTAGHQQKVALLSCDIANEMNLLEDQVSAIKIASLIHDIGKIHIPIEILNKTGKLNKHEFEIIKSHAQIGYDILKEIEFSWPIAQIILQHHERINGFGYPNGVSGQDILLEAKILAVADVVDAMTSNRAYRGALNLEEALEEITKNKNIFYDSNVVNACLKVFEKKNKQISITNNKTKI